MYPTDTCKMQYVALCLTAENALSVISALNEMSYRCGVDGRRVMEAKYKELATLFKNQYTVSKSFNSSSVE